tara:strand:+ start:469 stop:993 length:525 start_codon:yes stop_codon:yes gene_type:complete
MALEDQVNGNLTDFGTEIEFWEKAYAWEPKKQNQFIMSIQGIPAYLIKTSDKPKLQNGEVALDHINVKRYIKGKSEWQSISVTLYDAIAPQGAADVMNWVRDHHESATGRDGYSTFYKKNILLQQLSPLGEVIEEWELKGTFITDADFGSLDWGSPEAVEISLTLRFDYAIKQF